jgi:hypothetical protein
MSTIHLSFLLEFYQPPTQSPRILAEIVKECYVPMAKLFNCDLKPRFTISIAHSLMSLLSRDGRADEIVPSFCSALEKGTIEIVHSGAYHPIFPLLPDSEVVRQIELDFGLKLEMFGNLPRAGIIAPELCYDDRLLKIFQAIGFDWTIIDDKTMESRGVPVRESEVYSIDDFFVLTRSSLWSERIRTRMEDGRYLTGHEFVSLLSQEAETKAADSYKIIALCGETFGHHIKYFQETFLRDMLFALQHCSNLHLCRISDLPSMLPHARRDPEVGKDFSYFPPSSTATSASDLARGDPYPHWKSNGNLVHEALWALTDLILTASHRLESVGVSMGSLRSLMDSAFYSGQYFSASIWYWQPDAIYEGIDRQMRALYKYARISGDTETLAAGERLYRTLMLRISQETRSRGN